MRFTPFLLIILGFTLFSLATTPLLTLHGWPTIGTACNATGISYTGDFVVYDPSGSNPIERLYACSGTTCSNECLGIIMHTNPGTGISGCAYQWADYYGWSQNYINATIKASIENDGNASITIRQANGTIIYQANLAGKVCNSYPCNLNIRDNYTTINGGSHSENWTASTFNTDGSEFCPTPKVCLTGNGNRAPSSAWFQLEPRNLYGLNYTCNYTINSVSSSAQYYGALQTGNWTETFAIPGQLPDETFLHGYLTCKLGNGKTLPVHQQCDGINEVSNPAFEWDYIPEAYDIRSYDLSTTFDAIPFHPLHTVGLTGQPTSIGFRVISTYTWGADYPPQSVKINLDAMPSNCSWLHRSGSSGITAITMAQPNFYAMYYYPNYRFDNQFNITCNSTANVTGTIETFQLNNYQGTQLTNKSFTLEFINKDLIVDNIQQYQGTNGNISLMANVKNAWTGQPEDAICDFTARHTNGTAEYYLNVSTTRIYRTTGGFAYSIASVDTTLPSTGSASYGQITAQCSGSLGSITIPGTNGTNGTNATNTTTTPRASWYNSSWVNSRQFNISDSGGQIKIDVAAIGTNGTDMRWTWLNGSVEQPITFWRSDGSDGDTAWSTTNKNGSVWIYAPTGATTLYLYWNTSMADVSSAASVFYFYEPCTSTSQWTADQGSIQANGICYFSGGTSIAKAYTAYKTNATFTVDEMHRTSTVQSGFAFSTNTGTYGSTWNGYYSVADTNDNVYALYVGTGATWTRLILNPTITSWNNYTYKVNTTNITSTVNGNYVGGTSDTTYRADRLSLQTNNQADNTNGWDNIRVREYFLNEPTAIFINDTTNASGGIYIPGTNGTPGTNASTSTMLYGNSGTGTAYFSGINGESACPSIISCSKVSAATTGPINVLPFISGTTTTDAPTIECDVFKFTKEYANDACVNSDLWMNLDLSTYGIGALINGSYGNTPSHFVAQDDDLSGQSCSSFLMPIACTTRPGCLEHFDKGDAYHYTAHVAFKNYAQGCQRTLLTDGLKLIPGGAFYGVGNDITLNTYGYMPLYLQEIVTGFSYTKPVLRITNAANRSYILPGDDLMVEISVNGTQCQRPDVACVVKPGNNPIYINSSADGVGNDSTGYVYRDFIFGFPKGAVGWDGNATNQSVICNVVIRCAGAQPKVLFTNEVAIQDHKDTPAELAKKRPSLDLGAGIGGFFGGLANWLIQLFIRYPLYSTVFLILVIIGAPYIIVLIRKPNTG